MEMGLTITDNPTSGLIALQPLDQNPAAVYLAGLGKSSRGTMQQNLNSIAAMMTGGQADAFAVDWSALRFQHTNAVRSKLAEQYKPATANKALSALRGVLGAAFNLGQLSADDYLRATKLKRIKGDSLPKGRALSDKEIDALLKACADGTPNGARDGALLSILLSYGLRRSEAAALQLSEYDAESGAVIVRKGKGNKARVGYVADGAKKWLDDWLKVRGAAAGALFLPVSKSGKVTIEQMTSQAIWYIVERRAAQAGVKNITPHDFRRTFISNMLELTDVATVQKLAGHANVNTTLRYDRRDERIKAQAVKALVIPYYAAPLAN